LNERAREKTSLEDTIKSRMVQTIKYLIKTHINKNTKQPKLPE